jgi:hypothetical protein
VFFWSCLKILLVFPKCFSNFSKLLVRHTFSISGVFLIEDINLIKRERENCVFQLQVLNRSKSISGNKKESVQCIYLPKNRSLSNQNESISIIYH